MFLQAYKKGQQQLTIFLVILIAITLFAARLTEFNLLHGIQTLPKAFSWMVANLYITEQSFEKFPSIIDKIIETVFLSITSTTTAAVVALFLALMGSEVTKVNAFFSSLARIVASVYRNIPIVAWALILLISFGQNALTGYFALFLATFGFLTRAFIETIDETSSSSVEALRASGATYFQMVSKAVIPECSPQMISWVLYMIETNIRSSTLVGILTGTGIGFMFDLYYKNMDYNVVSLITMSIVVVVVGIELISNYVRRIIL